MLTNVIIFGKVQNLKFCLLGYIIWKRVKKKPEYCDEDSVKMNTGLLPIILRLKNVSSYLNNLFIVIV